MEYFQTCSTDTVYRIDMFGAPVSCRTRLMWACFCFWGVYHGHSWSWTILFQTEEREVFWSHERDRLLNAEFLSACRRRKRRRNTNTRRRRRTKLQLQRRRTNGRRSPGRRSLRWMSWRTSWVGEKDWSNEMMEIMKSYKNRRWSETCDVQRSREETSAVAVSGELQAINQARLQEAPSLLLLSLPFQPIRGGSRSHADCVAAEPEWVSGFQLYTWSPLSVCVNVWACSVMTVSSSSL